MWHGTCTPLALEILASGGFVPEPPRKRWDESTGHMASYRGTYFTSNFMTAKAAALNAMKKFGGNEVIFQVVAELSRGIPDEDHLPPAHEVLARSMGLAFLCSESAWDVLQKPKSKVQEILGAATEAYFADVEQRFLNAYGRHPDLGFSPAQREYLYPAVYNLMAVTLETIAGLHNPDRPWSSPEYKPQHQTPEMRRAINQVAVALTGILDQMPLDEWDPERFHIHNMRLDEPVGLGDGMHRVELAVEIVDPDRDRRTSPDNPYTLNILHGRMTPEFLREFEKSQVGEGRMDLVRIETGAKLASNPGLPTYDELTSKPDLSWADLGNSELQARIRTRKYGPPTEKDVVYYVVSSAYKSLGAYNYNLSKSEEWARMHQDTAERLSGVLPVTITPQEAFRVNLWMRKHNKIGMDEWDKMTELVCKKMGLARMTNPPVSLPPEASDRERTILMWIREFWAAREDWGWAESRSPVDAESANRRMHRATKALEVLKLFQKRGPMPTPELYMARVWKKYHPEWKP